MPSDKVKITLCNTCVRDNYGEGDFAETENLETAYRRSLKDVGYIGKPDIARHNCFNLCEMYHCIRVEQNDVGIVLKKISDPSKIQAVCEWVRDLGQGKSFDVPESLQEHVAEKQKLA
jgi:hypothetical protein